MLRGYIYRNKELFNVDSKSFNGFKDQRAKFWLDYSEESPDQINKISEFINLHPVTIEDLQGDEENTRTKYEEFNDYTFIVYAGVKKVNKDYIDRHIIYFLISKNFIVTVHKEDNKIIENLKDNKKKLKFLLSKGVDYLLHHLIDNEIDLYYPIVEKIEKNIEKADKDILIRHNDKDLDILFDIKSLNNELRSLIVPTTRMIARIIKPSNDHVRKEVMIYFRDVIDNLIRINESLQSSNDQITAIISERNTILSSNMNDIMKVLTIIATIMMPLTLITGVYGMNLPFLPGGHSKESFYLIMGLMLVISIVMLLYFKRKRWI